MENKVKFRFYSIDERYYEDCEFGTFNNESEFVDYMFNLNKEMEDCIGEQLTIVAYGDNFSVSSFYEDDSFEECEDDAKIHFINLKEVSDKDALMNCLFKKLYECLFHLSFCTIVLEYNNIPYEITIQIIQNEKED